MQARSDPVRRRSTLLGVLSVLLVASGLVEIGGGLWLALLGGSPGYVVAGIGWLVSGIALWRAHGVAALAAYGMAYAWTWAWALWEVGFDGWQLEPRLLLPTLFGLLLLTPMVSRRLRSPGHPGVRRALLALGTLGVAAAAAAGLTGVGNMVVAAPAAGRDAAPAKSAAASQAEAASDWRYYGGTPRGERYSPAAQITTANVARLRPAWQLHTGDLPRPGENEHGYEFNVEATPIKVGDTLYLCTPHRRVFAIDAQSGALRWKFDPQPDTTYNAYLACRGVAYADVDALATAR
jgi:glucose dehydrogenase